MRRYLLISPAFPPRSRIGARRALHLCRNLPGFGWQPVVLAAPPRDNHLDPRLAESLPPGLVVSHGYSGALRSLVHRLFRFRPLPFEETPAHRQRRLRERRILGQDLGFVALLRSAHVLCLVAGPARALQIPGKLYDYLVARRPILAISANAELNRILAASGSGTSTPYDDDGVQAAADLGRLYGRFQGGSSFDLDRALVEPYSAHEQARAIASILDEATA